MRTEDNTETTYRKASRLALESERLAAELVGGYWERFRRRDIVDWLNEDTLSVEPDGRILLTLGGPNVWLATDDRMMYQEFGGEPVGAYPPDEETSQQLAFLRGFLEELNA